MTKIFLRFDESGNQIDITTDQEYISKSKKDDWILTEDYSYTDLDFDSWVFKLDNDVVTLIEKEVIVDSLEMASIRDNSGRLLSQELFYEGGGVNSSRTTGWTRRFGNSQMNNRSGMVFKSGAVLDFIELTNRSTNPNKRVEIHHYDLDGRDKVLVYSKEITDQDNQFLYDDNLNLYIPPYRRLAIYLTGNSFSYPQYRLGYRRILN